MNNINLQFPTKDLMSFKAELVLPNKFLIGIR